MLVSETPADYGPNLAKLAREGYDLVIGVGFMIAPAVDRVAERFPDTKFAVVDNSTENLRNRNENVQGALFDEKQAGYLAGYVAGLFAIDNKIDQVSVVGGRRIPPVQKYVNSDAESPSAMVRQNVPGKTSGAVLPVQAMPPAA